MNRAHDLPRDDAEVAELAVGGALVEEPLERLGLPVCALSAVRCSFAERQGVLR